MRLGNGNGTGDGTEGAWRDAVFGTYLHGPVLARNPQIADLLIKLTLDVNALPSTDDTWYEALARSGSRRQPSPPDPPPLLPGSPRWLDFAGPCDATAGPRAPP